MRGYPSLLVFMRGYPSLLVYNVGIPPCWCITWVSLPACVLPGLPSLHVYYPGYLPVVHNVGNLPCGA